MALDIQIPYRGDQYLFQGISGAGAGIGEGIAKMTANLKKAKAYRVMAVDALGMDPEAVDKMGLDQLEGHFQAVAVKNAMAQREGIEQERRAKIQEMMALAQERQQKTQLAGDEAEAWPAFMRNLMEDRAGRAGTDFNPMAPGQPGAPGPEPMIGSAGGTGASARTGAFSPEELMAGMARMGKTSPRLSTALSRVLIPQLMQATPGPQPWKSPEGNPYVWMGHTMMPDRPGIDVNALMGGGQVPEGYEAVPTGAGKVQYLKTAKPIPESFQKVMDQVEEDLASANATLTQPDTAFVDGSGKQRKAEEISALKGYAQKRLDLALKRGKGTIDRYHSTGYLTPEQKEEMYGQIGIAAPAAKGKAAGAAPADDGKVTVADKTGKKFRLPKAQLAEAIKAGYVEVK